MFFTLFGYWARVGRGGLSGDWYTTCLCSFSPSVLDFSKIFGAQDHDLVGVHHMMDGTISAPAVLCFGGLVQCFHKYRECGGCSGVCISKHWYIGCTEP